MTDTLTDQALVLAIVHAVRDRGYPPSLQELADQFGKAKSTIKQRIDRLARDGYVVVDPNRRRAITVVKVPS